MTPGAADIGRPRPPRQATMKDVAVAAGVGVGTVSRVFSKDGQVSSATRQRVEAVAAELNYRPSGLARGLRRNSAANIGLIVADISNPFYGEFADGLLSTATARERHVILCASGEDATVEREYIDLLIEQRVAGIVAFPTGENVDAWQAAIRLGIRVLFVDRSIEGLAIPSIVVDNRAGARAATEYLLALGHKRIGYLGGPSHLTSGRLREEGFRLAHSDTDTPVDDRLVVRSRFTRDTAYASALRLLDIEHRPTALFAGNNVLGEAALDAARELSITIPRDLSLIMFDDVPWARLVQPGITVVAQPVRQMGALAARTVLAAQEPEDSIMLTSELTIRGSAKPHHS